MYKSIIYHILVIFLLSLMPVTGMAQQNTDINKPTRTRTTDKNKKTTDTKDNKNKDNKKAAQEPQPAVKNTEKKNDAQPAKAVEQPNKKADTKSADKKAEEPSAKQDVAKATTDTATKPAAPPKPKRVPYDPEKVQFDGIDVSKHQGNIDWSELRKNSKIQFVYVRATIGSNMTDNCYKENVRNARKQGFKVGSYHYFTNLSGAKAQFENFRKMVDRNDQDLLPMIDVEELNKWSKQQLRDSVMVFAELIEEYYGCKPLIYTNEKFFTSNLGRSFASYPLFIAKYSSVEPNIGYKWVLWQFSDYGLFRGAVKGNRGEVDLSRFNKGCSINDIAYVPSKHKPKNPSVKDAVDHKDKPATVNMTEQKTKETPKQTKKQQEEAKKQAEKEKNSKERSRKLAEEEAKKKAEADRKAKEKAEASKKAKEKAEANKKAKEKAEADRKAKEKAEQQKREKAREAEAQKAADAKAKRKAQAQQARNEQKAKQNSGKSNKSTSLMNTSSSKLSQSQRNDSIRSASQIGRKTNKSSADND